MHEPTVLSWHKSMALACALLLVALPVAAQVEKAAVTYGAESPQALVEKVKEASADEDLAQMAALMAPDDRATLSLTMTMMLGMVIAFSQMGGEMAGGMAEGMAEAFGAEMSAEDEAKAEAEKAAAMAQVEALEGRYEEILEQYGVSEMLQQEPAEGTSPSELMKDVDQVSLIRDLMLLLDSLPGDERSADSGPVDLPEGELTGVTVEGDRATGMLGDEAVDFVRVDGRWYLDLGLEEKMQQEGGGMMDDPNGGADEGQGGDGR